MSEMNEANTTQNSEFKPPRHWVAPEELEAGYWADAQIMEKRGQEFYDKPVEWLERMDKSPQGEGGMVRREFLTVMGASMAMASLSCARRPVHKIIPYVTKPEESTPGIPTWYASVSKDCPCGCGLLVKTRESRPIKLEGNPDHPLNRGKLCARAQASVLSLYDPDRMRAPKTSWDELDHTISSKLAAAAAGGGRVRVLTGSRIGPSTTRLITEFLSAFRAGAHVEFEPLGLEEISLAQSRCYGGNSLTPAYDFSKADAVLSLGADFLGTWISPVEHARDWAKNRKVTGQGKATSKDIKMSKFYCFEPNMSITGASADERFAVRPGDELAVALAVAGEILNRHKPARFVGDGNISAVLATYPAGSRSKRTSDFRVERLPKSPMTSGKRAGRSLVVGGGYR